MECSIGEINIVCTDAERSLRFYRDILGFDVLGEEAGCWHLGCGEAKFLLLPFAEVSRRPAKYCSEPCFSVDLVVSDLQKTKEYLESKGVEIDKDYPPNEERFFVRDPDGLVLEVIQS
jgi:catechol 2,3-dioxygenase-like lactoylglutathione lyase family enzyme